MNYKKDSLDQIVLTPIGKIYTPYTSIEDCPSNTRHASPPSSIVLFNQYEDALLDITAASHLIILYWLHLADRSALQSPTRRDGVVRGSFATRTKDRPNPIGMGVVQLLNHENRKLDVSGLDCINGSLLIDIKPYIAKNDAFESASISWQK